MTKQEYMAMSLPFNLKCVFDYGADDQSIEPLTGMTCYCEQPHGIDYDGYIDGCLPILHPLTDLTKPIEHNGEVFVPLSEIIEDDRCDSNVHHLSRMILNLDMKELCLNYPFWVVKKLIEWHFAVGLSEDDYIDVNTLEVNPYK